MQEYDKEQQEVKTEEYAHESGKGAESYPGY